jgi:hypothetical protein
MRAQRHRRDAARCIAREARAAKPDLDPAAEPGENVLRFAAQPEDLTDAIESLR